MAEEDKYYGYDSKDVVRVVLKETMPRSKVKSIISAEHFDFWRVIKETEETPYEVVWITRDRKSAIHYIEDFDSETHYIAVEGEQKYEILHLLSERLDVYQRDEIVELFRDADSDDSAAWLIKLAGVASPPDQDDIFLALFERASHDSRKKVRIAAIEAIVWASWNSGLPIEGVKSFDEDDEVREYADLALGIMADSAK